MVSVSDCLIGGRQYCLPCRLRIISCLITRDVNTNLDQSHVEQSRGVDMYFGSRFTQFKTHKLLFLHAIWNDYFRIIARHQPRIYVTSRAEGLPDPRKPKRRSLVFIRSA